MPQIAQVVKSTFRINHIGGNCPYTLSNTTARGALTNAKCAVSIINMILGTACDPEAQALIRKIVWAS